MSETTVFRRITPTPEKVPAKPDMSRILIVDDELSIRRALDSLLTHKGYCTQSVGTASEALRKLKLENFDLLITDLKLGNSSDGIELLQEAKTRHSELTTIMITGYGSVDSAVKAMKAGAYDFVTKPFRMESLLKTVQNALYHHRSARSKSTVTLPDVTLHFGRIVGESLEMQKIYQLIERVSKTDATVLIEGESGTGKELVAEAIHRSSKRKDGPYIPLNCAALSASLLESEMFGHVAGAFTGATKTRDGLFIAADTGTFFLDEIESMDLGIQSKLLRVLQESKVRRVGDTDQKAVDVRVIAATNESLEDKRDAGDFREDLYYRISVIPIRLPPLRHRVEDIPLLARYFCALQGQSLGAAVSFADEVIPALKAYSWPGNVRELQNAVACAAALCRNNTISIQDLPPAVRGDSIGFTAEADGETLKEFLEIKEKEYIQQVLNKTSGDLKKAARLLGISRATMYRKLPN